MLAIKLQRVGRKHQPSYRIVVAEKRSKMAGPPVEELGFYDPLTKEKSANAERVKYWMGAGAKPTATVNNLLISMGVVSGVKVAIKMKKKPVEEQPQPIPEQTVPAVPETAVAEQPQAEKPKETKQEEEKPQVTENAEEVGPAMPDEAGASSTANEANKEQEKTE